MRRQEDGTNPGASSLSVALSPALCEPFRGDTGSLLPDLALLSELGAHWCFCSGGPSCRPPQYRPLFLLHFSLEYPHLRETSGPPEQHSYPIQELSFIFFIAFLTI